MEFYWPEKNRWNDDLDVSEMFNIVQEKKEDLLEEDEESEDNKLGKIGDDEDEDHINMEETRSKKMGRKWL